MDIWTHVKALEGETLATLDRNKKFKVCQVKNFEVVVIPAATGKHRPVPRKTIEDAYRFLVSNKQLSRERIEKEFAPRNPVYVAAILAKMPGVDYRLKPITLIYRE